MVDALVAADGFGSAAPSARLQAFRRVATASVDQAAEQVGRIFCPHDLTPVRRSSAFSAQHNCADFDDFSVNYVAYGGSVSIDPGCLDRFFLVQVPLRGSARVTVGSHAVETQAGVAASLLSPTMPTRMIWQDDCAQLILLVERRLVEQRAASLSGKAVRPVEFDPVIDFRSAGARALQAQIEALADLAERLGPMRGLSRVAVADWRERLLDALLLGQRHDLSDEINAFSGQAEALPGALRRARDCLHARAAEPLDVAQLSEVAGLGIRALQIGFRRHFGVSISDMLRDIRLAHLNGRLRGASPDARIVDIAFDLGFTHLGRMSGAYRKKYGETPSATLRRLHRHK